MKVIENNKFYIVTMNGHVYGKVLRMQEHTAVNFAQDTAIRHDAFRPLSCVGKRFIRNFKKIIMEVKEIDLDRCPIIYKVENVEKKRMRK
jgi:translation initiation factor IF-1